MSKAVVLLSGGLDSATCCAVAKRDGFEIVALSFCYGQRHTVELAAARRVARAFGITEHRIAEIDLHAFGGALLSDASDVPKDRVLQAEEADIPPTYVPARNTIFLAYAIGWAEVLSCGDIFIGVNAVDYSGYPDCRPEYIEAFQKTANLATKAAVEGRGLTIHTPLINLSKAGIIRLGSDLGVDYGITHSCYD
ncbi:MAG: 7-cyano-7-deazaguanine synthase QueC, partial [Chitinivibrionales bacterium]|nr:7-cyano-7-deazaguanine synthase QueC [Chitinivibrionales bacterium]MBD3394589.1 7-cyano-7-deazaguanine synthase QueC [Chitinivibrionales bacterium]